MGILERIKEIEEEMARTQKNKATEHHLGGLKAKLARLRSQLLEPPKTSGSGKGDGFDVSRQGDARICLIGFPSVGKSTLLNSLTATSGRRAPSPPSPSPSPSPPLFPSSSSSSSSFACPTQSSTTNNTNTTTTTSSSSNREEEGGRRGRGEGRAEGRGEGGGRGRGRGGGGRGRGRGGGDKDGVGGNKYKNKNKNESLEETMDKRKDEQEENKQTPKGEKTEQEESEEEEEEKEEKEEEDVKQPAIRVLSTVGAYEFTTLCCQPSLFYINDARIQLLDLPGIIEGAAEGKGRGRQVIAVAHSCDLILMILDATKDDRQQELLTRELESVGIRLNKRPPNISLVIKKGGGLTINFIVTCPQLNAKMVQHILQQYRIYNADVVVREECTADEFIDVVEGNRKYVRCLFVYNKIDLLPLKEIDTIARRPYSVVVSSGALWNLEQLKERIWDELRLARIYTKRKGQFPDFSDPLILTEQRGPCTVGTAVATIHKDLVKEFKFAMVWGASAKYNPQRVGLGHHLADEDVIQIFKKI